MSDKRKKKNDESVRVSDKKLKELQLGPDDLCVSCDTGSFDFKTTKEVEPLEGFIGQDRAIEALELGLRSSFHGWNIYVVEPSGSGRNSILLDAIRKIRRNIDKESESSVSDLAAVYNFDKPDAPRFIYLEKGTANSFSGRIQRLLESLQERIPELFQRDEFHDKRREIGERFEKNKNKAIADFKNKLNKAFLETDKLGKLGFSLDERAPSISVGRIENDKVVALSSDEFFRSLSDEERKEISGRQRELVEAYTEMSRTISLYSEEMQDSIEEIREYMVGMLFTQESADILEQYGDALSYFVEGLRSYTVRHIEDFIPKEPMQNGFPNGALSDDAFLPFRINVLVDNSKAAGAPVIFEGKPTFDRLFGEIDRKRQFGLETSDHTMIRAGSFLKANGGVLVMSAEKALSVWERLAAVLQNERLDIGETPMTFALGRGGMAPETIEDIKVKVVLTGGRFIQHVLSVHPLTAQDFKELFHISAEFDRETERTLDSATQFARLIHSFCEREGLPHFSKGAVFEVLNYACRVAGHRNKFSLDMQNLKNLVLESAQWAGMERARPAPIKASDVKKALKKSIYRVDIPREKSHERIRQGLRLICLDGEKVGQVNGLAVFDTGDFSFAQPSRITARTFHGSGGVVSIEGVTGASGQVMRKSFETLKGYLGGKYGQRFDLSFSASVAFEQMYGQVNGDSASLAELYVVLSSLSGLPLKQGIALTGSMNQNGEVQPIAAVNEKIEGFFDVCERVGFTGEQGVIIPHSNIQNLALRDDVARAVRKGKFRIWAISSAEEGIEILTGVKAGNKIGEFSRGLRKDQDKYPPGTINFLVAEKLWDMSGSSKKGKS